MKETMKERSKKLGGFKKNINPQTLQFDEMISTWIDGACDKAVPVTGPIIKQKALELNKKCGGSDKLIASEGWLEKFKKRQEIRSLKITGTYVDYFCTQNYLFIFLCLIIYVIVYFL